MAAKWGLVSRAMFQSTANAAVWDKDHWNVEIIERPKRGTETTIRINADYLFLGTGAFTYPKVPDTPGIGSFNGQMLHTGVCFPRSVCDLSIMRYLKDDY